MKLSREITQSLVCILDNYIPPIIRDSLWFMYIPLRIVKGDKWRIFTTFKERAPSLTNDEYNEIYQQVQSIDLSRKTDTNNKCIIEIRKNIIGNTILDAGCGNGYLARLLAGDHIVTGIDINCTRLNTHEGNPVFMNGSLESLPFSDRSFDTVICAHTLEHVLDFERVVSELRRVARRRLIIIVPIQRPYRYTFDLHVRFFPTLEAFKFAMRYNNRSECRKVGGEIFYTEDYLV